MYATNTCPLDAGLMLLTILVKLDKIKLSWFDDLSKECVQLVLDGDHREARYKWIHLSLGMEEKTIYLWGSIVD